LGGSPSPLTGQDLESIARKGGRHDGLHDAVLPNGIAESFKTTLGMEAGLLAVLQEVGHRNPQNAIGGVVFLSVPSRKKGVQSLA
tara:strand:- start:18654 stop:18908 length:255 start_codon:yes stop_codon:yes gene_type:complete